MNLRGIANGLTQAVRPNTTIIWRRNIGWRQDDETGARSANFADMQFTAQIQALSSTDLKLMAGLNIQGYHRSVYLNGRAAAAMRGMAKGGDYFIFGGQQWKVTMVPEDWDDCGWTRVIVTLQQDCGRGSDV